MGTSPRLVHLRLLAQALGTEQTLGKSGFSNVSLCFFIYLTVPGLSCGLQDLVP